VRADLGIVKVVHCVHEIDSKFHRPMRLRNADPEMVVAWILVYKQAASLLLETVILSEWKYLLDSFGYLMEVRVMVIPVCERFDEIVRYDCGGNGVANRM
jgi:hypothetical protein